MNPSATCPECGLPLPAGAPGGLCPACLLKRGLETNTLRETSPTRAVWKPLAIEQLAAIFPELEILELIGRGGMGAVYKAREKQLDRLVALKILPPEIGRQEAFAQRFAREAQAMAKLSHSNIVTIHSFGQRPAGHLTGDGDLYYFIMEYVDGLSLRQLLDAGTVSPKEALAIVPQICDALQYAHDRGIVHRDIKPENILLSRSGQVKIADFGLAKLVGLAAGAADQTADAGSGGAPGVTQAGEKVMGTPQYMAPEQIERPREVDHRADIYSLGVVFYQMLTGELPKGKFEPPSRKVLIDVRLDEVVLRALEREPARRYQQVSEVRTQLETIVSTSGPATTTESTVTTKSPLSRKRFLYVGLFLFAATCAFASGIINLSRYGNWGSHDYAIMGVLWLIGAAGFAIAALRHYRGMTVRRTAKRPMEEPADHRMPPNTTSQSPALSPEAAAARIERARQAVKAPAIGMVIAAAINLALVLAIVALLGIRLNNSQHVQNVRTMPSPAFVEERDAWPEPNIRPLPDDPRVAVDPHYYYQEGMPASRTPSPPSEGASRSWGMLLFLVPLLLGLPLNILILIGSARMMQLRNRGLAITAAILALIAAPGNLIGLPMGIWALVVLSRREVVEAFTLSEGNKNMGKSRISLWLLLAVIAILTPVALWAASKAGEGQKTEPASQPAKSTTVPADFLPLNTVVERTVYDDGVGKDFIIDFDTGKLYTPTEEDKKAKIKPQDLWNRGFDAGAETAVRGPGLYCGDMIVIPLANERWEKVSLDGIRDDIAMGKPGTPVVMSALGPLPRSYIFKTREGSIGALQILELVNDTPRHIKIRYKLLEYSSDSAPAVQSSPHVLKTMPVTFANDVDPAMDRITVTFDRPMMDKSWSFTAGDKAFSEKTGSQFPERAGEISYDAARTTCTMPVRLQPGKVYWVGINSPSHRNFKTPDRVPAKRYVILFATRSADGKPTPLPEDLVARARTINSAAEPPAIDDEALQGKLKTWVEDFFSHNYRDITARKTLEWGPAERTPAGNLSIRYKYLATIWNKDQQIIEQRFTFSPEGKFISVETIEKRPATQPAGGPQVLAPATQHADAEQFQRAVQTVSIFLAALRQNLPTEAYRQTTAEYREAKKGGLERLIERTDLSKAGPTQVYVVMEAACVVVAPVTPKGQETDMSLGLGMIRIGDSYIIRDIDMLPNEQAVERYVDGFRKAYLPTRGGTTTSSTSTPAADEQ